MSQAAIEALLRDPAVARVFDLLDGGGEEARIAGGAVRDMLLGQERMDVDFATTAVPQEVMRRAEAAGVQAVPTGIEHGTVTLVVEGRPFEVTTLRADVETHGRRARVAFSRDWAEDAARRDFTINGLYLDRAGRVHDLVGGEADLAERRVRFIGAARQRIEEDFLRILRFFRFHAAFGAGPPDADGLAAAVELRAGLRRLSAERIRQELLRMLGMRNGPEVGGIMSDCGIMPLILASAPWTARLLRLAALERVLGRAGDAVLRLAALAVFTEEDADRLRDRLRLSNREHERLRAAGAIGPMPSPDMAEPQRRELLYRLGAEPFRDRAMLRAARKDEDVERWLPVLALAGSWAPPPFPVSGADLLARGLRPGPELGRALKRIEERWIAAGFPAEIDAATIVSEIDGDAGPDARGHGNLPRPRAPLP